MLINYCEKHIPNAEIHVITCANVVKGWYNAKWATTVLDKILELTGTEFIKVIIHIIQMINVGKNLTKLKN